MNLRKSSTVLAAVLAFACTRSNADRDSQIGRTTYDGSEDMQPASGTVTPVPERRTAPAAGGEAPPAATVATPSEAARAPVATMSEATDGPAPATRRTPDVIYVPTPQPVVDRMLELARVQKDDLVYDLGCGDGRIVVTAAKRYGARAVGFDIDPERVREARANVKKSGVEHLVTIEEKDIFTLDLTPANVVTLYLLPNLNKRLLPQLERLAPGSRVVSHNYDIEGVVPARSLDMKPKGENEEHSVFFYTLPFERTKSLALPRPVAPAPAAR
jgi:SAM-dependent methyltransferase